MTKTQQYVLVLWGNDFHEVQTTYFVTYLRKAKQIVKLVSLTGPRSKGAHGLTLLSDLSLSQALPLANDTQCVIVPGGKQGLLYLAIDPRIQRLFQAARANGAYFVIPQLDSYPPIESSLLPLYTNRLLFYEDDCPVQFVGELVALLKSGT